MSEEAKKGSIVIIDNDEFLAKIVAETLERQGYQTRIYTNGQAAINSIKEILERGNKADISVILSDIKMPRKDGIETVEEILSLCKGNKPKILFMSGQCNSYQKIRAEKISPYEILEKPFLTAPLLERINSANVEFYKMKEH